MSDETVKFLWELLLLLVIFEFIRWFWTEANIKIGRFHWQASSFTMKPFSTHHGPSRLPWWKLFSIRPHRITGSTLPRWNIWVYTRWGTRCQYFSACYPKTR